MCCSIDCFKNAVTPHCSKAHAPQAHAQPADDTTGAHECVVNAATADMPQKCVQSSSYHSSMCFIHCDGATSRNCFLIFCRSYDTHKVFSLCTDSTHLQSFLELPSAHTGVDQGLKHAVIGVPPLLPELSHHIKGCCGPIHSAVPLCKKQVL